MSSPGSSQRSLPGVLLGPLGLAGLLLVVSLVLAVLYVSKDGGGTEIVHEIVACDPGKDPNCKARFPIHEHANLALYVRGERFDFDKPEFVSTEDREIGSLAHIHEPRHGVVHVHMSGTTWDEFFRGLGFDLLDPTLVAGTSDAQACLTLPGGERLCGAGAEKLRFMVNGVRVDGVSGMRISDLDRVLIAYGAESDAQLLALYTQVGDDACIPSQFCLARVGPDEAAEPCAGRVAGCVK